MQDDEMKFEPEGDNEENKNTNILSLADLSEDSIDEQEEEGSKKGKEQLDLSPDIQIRKLY